MPANNALIVADADSDRRHELADALEGMGFDVRVVSDASAALDACESAVPSAVVCDVRLPGGGVDLIQALRSRIATAGVRVVLTLDPADQTPANRARFAAADAALVRPFQPRTLAACLRTLEAEAELFSGGDDDGQADVAGFFEIADAKARRENPLLPQLVDAMTGLWNEAYTELKLAEEFKKARRFGVPLSCVVFACDIPFPATGKGRADRRRLFGDLSSVLLCESRDVDHLARLDDDRFLALLPHTDAAGAAAMATRVSRSIEARGFVGAAGGAAITVSAGVSSTADDVGAPEDMVKRACEALDFSRRFGVNRVSTWTREAAPAS